MKKLFFSILINTFLFAANPLLAMQDEAPAHETKRIVTQSSLPDVCGFICFETQAAFDNVLGFTPV